MVVDNVDNHFESGLVQCLHHCLELADGVLRGIASVRREITDRVIAPVVPQTALDQRALVDERMHGHQFDRRDAQALQVLDRRRRRETRIRAAQRGRDVRMAPREPAHVQLVDHRLAPGNGGRSIVVPGERRLDDAALRHCASTIATIV